MLELKDKKKILFNFIVVAFPFFLLALLEFSLRIFSYGEDLSLFVSSPDPRYYEINRHVGERFFSKLEKPIPTPLSQYFLREKPEDEYRIFVLGESSVQGFPYDANLAFTTILRKWLQDTFPDRTIEVVNLGMTAINSYALLDFTDEILQQKPDAILIYTGHNEYYGALGVASMENGSIPVWTKKLRLRLVHLRTYQLIESGIVDFVKMMHPQSNDESKGTLMEKMVGKDLVPYASKMYSEGLKQFSDNMGALLWKFKDAGVPVIISDLVSNVRDLAPFRSVRYGIYPPADSVYQNARRLEEDGFSDKAKDEYIRAKDLDVIRFRAPEDFNEIIAHLADSLGAYSVSLKLLFEEHSLNGIVGDNLMTDHLHPNIDGQFLMADGFLDALRLHGMIEERWDTSKINCSTCDRADWGYTELDSLIAHLRIEHLKAGWPFQPESTANNFRNTYIPHGIIDSLAFMTIQYANINSITAHKKLAAYYESIGDPERASKEYFAIAYTAPLDVSSYYYASSLAVKASDFTNAIRYLKESPGSDTSSYAQFTLASIYSSQKHYKDALLCIEKLESASLNRSTALQVQILKYRVQKDSGLALDAGNTLAVIRNMDPTFTGSDEAGNMMILMPAKIKPYIDKAEAMLKVGQVSEALDVLKDANNIREVPYTDLLIGKILFAQKNIEALPYLEKARAELENDPSLVYRLCVLYMIKRDMTKAKSAMNDFAKLQGVNDPQYKQLKEIFEKRISGRE
ncbi:MAG TPA: hypothetical protein VLX91_04995 [Candidatus Acidoferrales bacterium]|nr:hypothetical protein [Candidatus Acidoferrales bacterium]